MLDCSAHVGFLKERNDKLRCSVGDDDFKTFSLLKSDEERFTFIYNLPASHSYPICLLENVKNPELGRNLKEDGNKVFQGGDYHTALQLYNKSVQNCSWSGDLCSELAVVVANRSAALYHTKSYQHALDDIQLALTLSYPPQLHYKVLERKARCLLATNQLRDALQAFKMALTSLDTATNLQPDKRSKAQRDIQIMIAILLKNENLENAPLPTRTSGESVRRGQASKTHPCASCVVTVKQDQEMGRYATARREVSPGETLLVEQPHCAVLLAEYCPSHCSHCFHRLVSLVPCRRCCNVAFCSMACQQEAMQSYHNIECPVTEELWASGASVTSLMAVRILSQHALSYFLDMRQQLSQLDAGAAPQVPYRSSDYATVYQLVRHQHLRTPEDFFQRTAVAVFLFRCLRQAGYFGPSRAADDGGVLTEDERFVGGLLLRHLQLLQFNAHEVSELQLAPGAKLHDGKSTFIGGGLYPTLALFNHSCEPGVVRYFNGTSVVVRTVKTVRAGEIIAENYGPIFTRVRRDVRRSMLQEQYWFHCRCVPCEENWPLFEELDPGVMRFHCGAEDGSPCRAVIRVPVDTADFMVCCPSCHRYTNIMKGLKTLQETDAMYRVASDLMERGQVPAALTKFLQVLRLLDRTLAPPFPDYHLCQQSVRRCMLSLGNVATHVV